MRWPKVLTFTLIMYVLHRYWRNSIRNISMYLPKHKTRRFARRDYAEIEQIVVHHSGGPLDQSISDIARYHIGPNHVCAQGCPGILYHYAITRKGEAFQVNQLTTIAWHLAGQNTKSVGVVFIGNYDEYPASVAQLKALKRVIRAIEEKVGRRLAVTDHGTQCSGCTNCPGEYLLTQIYR